MTERLTDDEARAVAERVAQECVRYGLEGHEGNPADVLLRHLEGNRAATEGMQRLHIETLQEQLAEARRALDTSSRQFQNLYLNYQDASRVLDEADVPKYGTTKPDGFAELYPLDRRIRMLVLRQASLLKAARKCVRLHNREVRDAVLRVGDGAANSKATERALDDLGYLLLGMGNWNSSDPADFPPEAEREKA